jgi:hypothetical protein
VTKTERRKMLRARNAERRALGKGPLADPMAAAKSGSDPSLATIESGLLTPLRIAYSRRTPGDPTIQAYVAGSKDVDADGLRVEHEKKFVPDRTRASGYRLTTHPPHELGRAS